MKTLLLIALLSVAGIANAQMEASSIGMYDVVAPTTFGDPVSTSRIQGMMYYDAATGNFKAIGNSGTPVVLGTTGATAVTSGGSGERIERATINMTGPVIISQSGSWVTGIANPGAGNLDMTFTGAFSSAPTCTYKCQANFPRGGGTATTTSSMRVSCTDSSATGYNTIVEVICMGPR